MKFRFIGRYTNGRTSIMSNGHLFVEHEPTEVDGAEAIRRLSNNVEFEVVEDAGAVDAAFPAIMAEVKPAQKHRGRKPKAAE